VVNAAPLTAKPPPAVSNPPTLKTPESDALPIVRVPIYAEAVLIVVVEIPAVVRTPPSANDPINAFDTLIVEITPYDALNVFKFNVEVVIELALITFVLIEFVTISFIIKNPNDGPIVKEFTVRDEKKPNWELIVVVDRPPAPVIKPPTVSPLVIDSVLTVREAIYALAVLIVVVDKPLLRTVSPPTVRPPVVIDTELL